MDSATSFKERLLEIDDGANIDSQAAALGIRKLLADEFDWRLLTCI